MSENTESSSKSGTASDAPFRRRVLLINPKFQLTFLIYMIVIAATVIIVLYVANFFFFKRSFEAGRALDLPPDHIYFAYLDSQKTTMKWVFLLASGVTLVNLVFWGLYLSHRVAGPIYRLRKHMVDLREGRTQGEVGFRKNDFFPELAESFNQHMSWVRENEKKR